jgi:hypothetical protein
MRNILALGLAAGIFCPGNAVTVHVYNNSGHDLHVWPVFLGSDYRPDWFVPQSSVQSPTAPSSYGLSEITWSLEGGSNPDRHMLSTLPAIKEIPERYPFPTGDNFNGVYVVAAEADPSAPGGVRVCIDPGGIPEDAKLDWPDIFGSDESRSLGRRDQPGLAAHPARPREKRRRGSAR